jgi:hypothetical protein
MSTESDQTMKALMQRMKLYATWLDTFVETVTARHGDRRYHMETAVDAHMETVNAHMETVNAALTRS